MWYLALLMGCSMRLKLTLVRSLNVFQLVWLWVLYRSYSAFFLECVYFSLLYPSLIFDMFCRCVCLCVCARVGVVLGFTNSYFSSLCRCKCVSWDFLCVGRYGFKFAGNYFLLFSCIYVYTCLCMLVCAYIYIYIYIYKRVCVCVCVCLFPA